MTVLNTNVPSTFTLEAQAAAKKANAAAKALKAKTTRAAAKADLKSSKSDPALAALKATMNAEAKALVKKVNADKSTDKATVFINDVTPRKAGKAALKNVTKAKAAMKTTKGTASASFTAITASLSTDETANAKAAARAAVNKAAASSKAPSVKPADTARYCLGAYKGRAGAMYEFMKRAGGLPEGFTREAMVDSCTRKAPHAAVGTRAQVLDYFAWAVRHGLLHVTESTPAAAKVKAAKGRKAVSKLLQNPAA